jgi:hypothetical protein
LLRSLGGLWSQSCVELILWYNLDNSWVFTPLCDFLVFLVVCPNYIPFWLLKVFSMRIYLLHIICHALLSLIQYIGWTPINPKSAKMCMKFKFISMCTYLCGACHIYCSVSNYFGRNEFGDHIVLEYVLGTWEIYWCLSQ